MGSYRPPQTVNVLRKVNTDRGDIGPGIYKLPSVIADRLLSIGAAEEIVEKVIDVEPEPPPTFTPPKAKRSKRQHRMMTDGEHGDVG